MAQPIIRIDEVAGGYDMRFEQFGDYADAPDDQHAVSKRVVAEILGSFDLRLTPAVYIFGPTDPVDLEDAWEIFPE